MSTANAITGSRGNHLWAGIDLFSCKPESASTKLDPWLINVREIDRTTLAELMEADNNALNLLAHHISRLGVSGLAPCIVYVGVKTQRTYRIAAAGSVYLIRGSSIYRKEKS